jgi:trk system potassium uptake protein TrkA
MNIIIAGVGKVGFLLAKTLSKTHNVYLIEKNRDSIKKIDESIDIMPIVGDIVNPQTYDALQDLEFDIFIAVTDSDETNILSTLIADDKVKLKSKIVRLKNPYFANSTISNKLGIKKSIFPLLATAKSIASLIDFPKANNVKKIPFTNFKLISVKANNSLIENYLDINSQNVVIAAYERDRNLYFAMQDSKIGQGDLIYLIGEPKELKEVCSKLDTTDAKPIKNIAILGANLLGVEIAKHLKSYDLNIKLFDRDISLCQKASEVLDEKVMVINSKYIEHTIYEDENIKHADMVIATSNNDENNIIKSIEAKEYGVRKCVAINNDIAYYDLMYKLGITAIRGAKTNAYYAIIESIASNNIINEKHFCGGRGVVLIRKVYEDACIIDKSIKVPKKEGLLLLVARQDQLQIVTDEVILQADDTILLFANSQFEEELRNWIATL